MKVYLWRGFHHQDLIQLLAHAWQENTLVILIPSHLKDFSFATLLTTAQVDLHGDWPTEIASQWHAAVAGAVGQFSAEVALPMGAVLGVFTSGTQSGKHRLVFYSKNNVQSSLDSIRRLFDVSRIQNIFLYPQPTHTFGLVLGYMHAVLNRIPLNFYAGAYTKAAHEHWLACANENTLTLGTPIHFVDLMQFVANKKTVAPKTYSCIIGGAKVAKDLWLQVRDQLHIEQPTVGYGATEASPGVTHLPPGVVPQEDGDIGYVLDGVQMEIIPEQGMRFRGPNVCLAIFDEGRVQHFDSILLRDQLIPTTSGRYSFVGRTDMLINRGGLKLSLEAIESAVGARLQRQCVAVAVYDERLGEDVGLLLASDDGSVVSESDRSRALAVVQEMFGVKLAHARVLNAKLPFNANGKIDRLEALKIYLRGQKWQLPVAVQYLEKFLPHRGSAVWIDAMSGVRPRYGAGIVRVDLDKPYCTDRQVRESSVIEWVAQTYGYAVGLNDILGNAPADKATKTFIAKIKNCEILEDLSALRAGEVLDIQATCSHDFGALKIVQGQVLRGTQVLANVGLTFYIQ